MEEDLLPSLEECEAMNRAWEDQYAAVVEQHTLQRCKPPLKQLNFFTEGLAGNRVLDLGSGIAYYADEFVKRGFAYTGIDLSLATIEKARARWPELLFREMSFRKLDFPSESFDGVWSCCALRGEPKRNFRNVIMEANRVLAPDGILSLIVPEEPSYEEVVETPFGPCFSAGWSLDEMLAEFLALKANVIRAMPDTEGGAFEIVIRKPG